MKNKLLLLGVLGLVPFMTACGGGNSSDNQLLCTMNSGVGTTSYYFDFDKDDKLTGGHIEEYVVYEEAACGDEDECETFIENALDGCKKSADYNSCKISKQDSKSATITANFEKSSLDEAGISVGTSKADVKSAAESHGFKCK